MSSGNSLNFHKDKQPTGKKSIQLLKTSQERKRYANELMEKVKGHIPVIIEAPKDLALELHDPNKVVLVGSSLKMLNFLEFLRKKVKIDQSACLFLFANDKYLVKTSDLMGEIYAKYRNEDGFLYLRLSQKQVWG